MQRYNPKEIEPKWQKIWDEQQTYKADLRSSKPKYVGMSMFNYPSGAGIHIGHAMNYTISDVKARFKRQQGYESYHPVGWDAFGLPAENFAIKAGVSPQASMAKIIPSYHKQYKAMGWSNDWSKEIATHDPKYYKWTQWIFSQMYKHGLAYQDSRMQWWCDKDKTVLSNEQVIDGKCWRHDGPDDPLVAQKEVKQWFFKITEYADELLEATDDLDWTEPVKTAQKNWIGRSVGAEITFPIKDSEDSIAVFTTRADTIFSGAFVVLAPEHELARVVATKEKLDEVEAYIHATQLKSELERQADKEKSGVFTGAYAINPANGEEIPIWLGDFVLPGYGTGAVFGDIHDERDFEFIKKYDILARTTVVPEYIDTVSPTREGVETIERIAVQCIVKHPTENTYLLLERLQGEQQSFSFVTGGLEAEDTDIYEGAKRELIEETGYKNIKSISTVGAPYYAEFYHDVKKVNRRVLMHTVSIELSDLTQADITEDETALHNLHWVSLNEMSNKVFGEGCKAALITYQNGAEAYTGEGVLIDSAQFSGLRSEVARDKIIAWLAEKGAAVEKVNYKMRDWSVSRQRYWGAPIPIIYCKDCGTVPVPDDQLPVVLPELDDFQPSGDGRSALARATDWLNTECPKCGGAAERETDTLDTYICSSWYMFRYFDPENTEKIFESDIVNKWAPIDFYNGGDHATAHLLYARFITRFFTKIGLMENPEPFKQMLYNGKVLASDGTMFSKSKGNGVDPLDIINSGYGADALRTYLMFAAPLEFSAKWDSQGVPATHRFISRVWNLTQEYLAADECELSADEAVAVRRVVHPMIKKITEDIEASRYNTAIATAMGAVNDLYKLKTQSLAKGAVWQEALEAVVACTAPFAPHASEELWQNLGHKVSVHHDSWPSYDKQYLTGDTVTVIVQVNGKLRGKLELAKDVSEEDAIAAAKEVESITAHLSSDPKRIIFVPNKLLNFVV